MKYFLKRAGLLLALTIVLGTGPMTAPALAGPDLEPFQPPGWSAPIIVSANPDQNGNHGPLPTQLFGSAPSFFGMSMINTGDVPGNTNVLVELHIDDLDFWTLLAGSNLGTDYFGFNQGETISGGRHTVWMDIDTENALAEDDETNNQTARQFVWTPEEQPHNTVVQFASPPDPWVGQDFLSGGTLGKANVDAVTLQSGGEFGFIVAVAGALEEGNDYDVFLHPRPTNAVDGLDTTDPLTSSQVGGAFVDGVVLNDNHLSISERFSVSVMNYNATDSPYLLDIGRSLVPRSTGFVLDGTFSSDQLVHVEEWSLFSDTEPRTAVLDVPGAVQDFTLAVYDPQTGLSSLRDNLGMVTTDENGRATVTFTPDQAGFYGVAVFRNAFEGTAAEDFTLRLIDAPADLALAVLPGSHAPMTPYLNPLPVPFGDPLPAPTVLEGDSFQTGVYMHYSNIGPGSIGIASLGIRRDGAPIAFTSTPALEPDPDFIGTNDFDALSFSGGRHTLSMHLDSSDQHFELDESNNDFAEQWIWQPTQLPVAGSRERGAPPLRDGGHEFIPEGVVRYENIHGVRSPAFQSDGADGFWAGVSILASGDVDLDLRLFDPSTGVKDGFVDPLKTSNLGSSQVDFILMNFNQMALNQFWDIGVERYLGEAYYSVQVSHSQWMGEINQATDMLEESGSLAGIGSTTGRESMALFEFKLDDELADQPLVAARVKRALGSAYHELGDLDRSVLLLRQVHRTHRLELGPDHEQSLTSQTDLANVLLRQDRNIEADSLYSDLVERYRRTLGETHPKTVAGIHQRGVAMWEMSRYDEAEPLLRRSYELVNEAYADNPRQALSYANNLANFLGDAGQFSEAESLLQMVVEERIRILGPEHPEVLEAWNNLAMSFADQGRIREGLPIFRRVLTLQDKLLGPGHFESLITRHNLAAMQALVFNWSAAETLRVDGVRLAREFRSPEERVYQFHVHSLGQLYLDMGRFATAETLLTKAYELRRQTREDDHRDVYFSLDALGRLELARGKLDLAYEHLQAAREGYERNLGHNHPNTISSRMNIARWLLAMDRPLEARAMLAEAVEAFREAQGDGHWGTLQAEAQLTRADLATGRAEAGRQRLSGTIEVADSSLDSRDPMHAVLRLLWAACAWEEGNDQRADSLLTASLARWDDELMRATEWPGIRDHWEREISRGR